jgi:hypothetical protein
MHRHTSLPYIFVLYVTIFNSEYIGFEVLTAVLMKSCTSRDIMQYSPLKDNPTFRRNVASIFQDRRISQARNYDGELSCYLLRAGSLLRFYSSTLKWRWHVPLKCRLDFQLTARCYIPEDRILSTQNICNNGVQSLRPIYIDPLLNNNSVNNGLC